MRLDQVGTAARVWLPLRGGPRGSPVRGREVGVLLTAPGPPESAAAAPRLRWRLASGGCRDIAPGLCSRPSCGPERCPVSGVSPDSRLLVLQPAGGLPDPALTPSHPTPLPSPARPRKNFRRREGTCPPSGRPPRPLPPAQPQRVRVTDLTIIKPARPDFPAPLAWIPAKWHKVCKSPGPGAPSKGQEIPSANEPPAQVTTGAYKGQGAGGAPTPLLSALGARPEPRLPGYLPSPGFPPLAAPGLPATPSAATVGPPPDLGDQGGAGGARF